MCVLVNLLMCRWRALICGYGENNRNSEHLQVNMQNKLSIVIKFLYLGKLVKKSTPYSGFKEEVKLFADVFCFFLFFLLFVLFQIADVLTLPCMKSLNCRKCIRNVE